MRHQQERRTHRGSGGSSIFPPSPFFFYFCFCLIPFFFFIFTFPWGFFFLLLWGFLGFFRCGRLGGFVGFLMCWKKGGGFGVGGGEFNLWGGVVVVGGNTFGEHPGGNGHDGRGVDKHFSPWFL